MIDRDIEIRTDLLQAFGSERFDRALGTARAWLLRSVLEQVSSGDPRRLTELAEADALLIEKALLLAELTALEQLDHAESHSTSPEAIVLRGACLNAFYLLRALTAVGRAGAREKNCSG